MRDVNKAFGAAVCDARRRQGLTQCQLAEKLGKTDRALSDLENGKTSSKLDTVAQIALTLNVSVDAAIGVTPEGDVPLCVKQFFTGMSAEEAAGYIRLCEAARALTK